MKIVRCFPCTLALLTIVSVGCGIEPSTLESLREAVDAVSDRPSATAMKDETAVSVTSEPTFEAPFPDRVDPFSFPALQNPVERERHVATSVAQVEVLGFAEVDEPRVLLRSSGESKSLRVGESMQGIQVVDIDAPQVKLQLGSLIWTAKLFD